MFVWNKISTQSYSAKFLYWGDHVNSVPDLAASPPPPGPEFLPELVFAYNCTPHSTTSYSPYYLFFSREPTLPLDHLLGTASNTVECTEWIAEHQEHLEQAFKLASERTDREASWRQTRHNLKGSDTNIPVGARVFLRNCVQGHNKMQDV